MSDVNKWPVDCRSLHHIRGRLGKGNLLGQGIRRIEQAKAQMRAKVEPSLQVIKCSSAKSRRTSVV